MPSTPQPGGKTLEEVSARIQKDVFANLADFEGKPPL
jgi:hypothetical protein